MGEIGAYCEIYGDTIRNRVMEYLLENQDLDIAVGDLAKDTEISRPKAYEIIEDFEEKDYIQKSRVVGRTQLFLLNKKNKRIKLFLRNFRDCLKIIAEEHQEKKTKTTFHSGARVGMASARNS